MKFKRTMAALLAASMMISFSACKAEPNDDEEEVTAESDEAESLRTRLVSADSAASTIKSELTTILTKMDTAKSGMKMSSTSLITITVEDGVWKVTNGTPDSFRSNMFTWNGSGSSDSGSEDGAEDFMAAQLADRMPNVKSAGISAWFESGGCLAVSFTEDSSTPDSQVTGNMGEGGWLETEFEWNGKDEGVSTDGNVVGTSPKLRME